ncbi:uncharacterized protein LOC111700126 [Eurytemora carolleeae]|uniref:uncharacterized protein LOC111700126 n=1 Tax=Eurytemora carolleeae TaxID=1294199 RepID=UPI000C76F6A5|nr:uncharacterized protein LOC111700126 [Eurytemora carolleeae]|eukprot:XP_023326712.1 uncharacterized protein LOC111700126 [Eurytemora affinis]
MAMESRNIYPGVEKTNYVKDNGRRKLLIIGKTGTGKSSLCNVITGYDHDADIYPVSADPESCTQGTKFANVLFNGDPTLPISLIDTIGFDDATKNDDAAIIAELVSKLNNDCDHVNLFAIAVNGQNPRLDGSLVAIIRIFEEMFTTEFWKQAVVIFTRVQQDVKTKTRREQKNKKSDVELAANYMRVVEEKFPSGKGLKYLHMDACYDKDDNVENAAFLEALGTLRKSLEDNPGLTTASIRRVETENETLRRKIKEQEQWRKEAEDKFKEAVENMGCKAKEERELVEAKMLRMMEEQNAKTEDERRKTEKMHQQHIQALIEAEEEREKERQRELEVLKKDHEDKGLPTIGPLDKLRQFIEMIATPIILVIEAVAKFKA